MFEAVLKRMTRKLYYIVVEWSTKIIVSKQIEYGENIS
jgi:hypothetical protein